MAEGCKPLAGCRFEDESEEGPSFDGLAGSIPRSIRLRDVREGLADRPVTPSLWRGPLLTGPFHQQRSSGPFGSILVFEELDEITRDFMLMEFEAFGRVQSSPTCKSLSPLGRDALPLFLHAVIGSADETALIRAISHRRYWNEGSEAGDGVVSLVPPLDYLSASVRVATHEFNAWYVRGLAARLLSEGETKCEVHVAAADPCRNILGTMRTIIRAAFLYFGLVLGTGFVLGVLRVPLLVPRIGERWAELAEMPLMAAAVFLFAGYVLRRFPEIRLPGQALVVGFLALALSVCAELGLAVALQSQPLGEYLGGRDKVSGSVYLLLLLVFALMPRLRLRNHA